MELSHPKSVYMYKEGDFPLKAGPVWDFDWATFGKKQSGYVNSHHFWYKKLFFTNKFQSILREEWIQRKDIFSSLIFFIDSVSTYIQKSNEYNFKLWRIEIDKYSTGDELLYFEESIEFLKRNYSNRINELNSKIIHYSFFQ